MKPQVRTRLHREILEAINYSQEYPLKESEEAVLQNMFFFFLFLSDMLTICYYYAAKKKWIWHNLLFDALRILNGSKRI